MKKRGLLFSAFSMLMVSVIALSGATYAWFISTQAPRVEEIEVSVVSPANLKISTTNSDNTDDYYSTISRDMWEGVNVGAGKTYKTPALYHNVDAMDAVTPRLEASGKIRVASVSMGNFPDNTGNDGSGTPASGSATDPDEYIYDGLPNELDYGFFVDFQSFDGENTNNYLAFDLFFANEKSAASGKLAVSLDIRGTAQTYFSSLKEDSSWNAKNTVTMEQLMHTLRVAFIITEDVENVAGGTAKTKPDNIIFYEPNDAIAVNTPYTGHTGVTNDYEEAFFVSMMNEYYTEVEGLDLTDPTDIATAAGLVTEATDYANEYVNRGGTVSAAQDGTDPDARRRWQWPIEDNGANKQLTDTGWPYNWGTNGTYADDGTPNQYKYSESNTDPADPRIYIKESTARTSAYNSRIPLFEIEPSVTGTGVGSVDKEKVVNMRVIVWMEGWDEQSCSAVAGGMFVNALQFYSVAAA